MVISYMKEIPRKKDHLMIETSFNSPMGGFNYEVPLLRRWIPCPVPRCSMQQSFFRILQGPSFVHLTASQWAGPTAAPTCYPPPGLKYWLLPLKHRKALYSDPGLSTETSPLESTPIPGSKYFERMWCSLSPKDTSLIRRQLFDRRAVPIRGGMLH